eukprot:scaffold168803_cov37-Tisochrysis_lutea.AAC.2
MLTSHTHNPSSALTHDLCPLQVDPLVDPETIRLYDVWMDAKLANGTDKVWLDGTIIEQEPLGGRSQQAQRLAQQRAQLQMQRLHQRQRIYQRLGEGPLPAASATTT